MNVLNFLQALKIALALLPIIHDTVDQVEKLFPQGGNGAQKLEMVKGMIENVLAVSDSAGASMEVIWPIVSGMIANIVSLKKAVIGTATPATTSA